MVYENCKMYGPYTSKQDGRLRVIMVYENKDKKTISYPKYLVEKYLNRYLSNKETVDHIDGNFIDNDLSNLRVIERSKHCSDDAIANKDEIHLCIWCKTSFIIKGANLHYRNRKLSSGFCSKKCSGQYGAWIQKENAPLLTTLKLEKVKYKKKECFRRNSKCRRAEYR